MKTKLLIGLVSLTFVLIGIVYISTWGFHDEPLSADLGILEIYINHLLYGKFITLGPYTQGQFNQLGPMMFWFLLPLYWVSGKLSSMLFMGALFFNLVVVVGWLWLIQKEREAFYTTLPIIILTLYGLGGILLISPWNPHLVVLPLGLLLFICAYLCTGRIELLPIAVLVGSFLIQTYYATGLVVVVVMFVSLVVMRNKTTTKEDLKWVTISILILVVLWSVPFIEELTNFPDGNISKLLEFHLNNEEGLPFLETLMITGQRVIPFFDPIWLGGAPTQTEEAVGSAMWVSLLVISTFIAKKRGNQIIFYLGMITITALPVAIFSVSRIPNNIFGATGYYTRWLMSIGVVSSVVIINMIPFKYTQLVGILSIAICVFPIWTPLDISPTPMPSKKSINQALKLVEQSNTRPIVEFSYPGRWIDPAALINLLYKHKVDFGVNQYKWPLQLPQEFKSTGKEDLLIRIDSASQFFIVKSNVN